MCYGMMDCCVMYWKEGCLVKEREVEGYRTDDLYVINLLHMMIPLRMHTMKELIVQLLIACKKFPTFVTVLCTLKFNIISGVGLHRISKSGHFLKSGSGQISIAANGIVDAISFITYHFFGPLCSQ